MIMSFLKKCHKIQKNNEGKNKILILSVLSSMNPETFNKNFFSYVMFLAKITLIVAATNYYSLFQLNSNESLKCAIAKKDLQCYK